MVKDPPAVSETWVWSLGWEDPLEKGMATHSSILAWRIPWTSNTLLKALLLAPCRMKSFHSGWQEKEGALPKPGGTWGLFLLLLSGGSLASVVSLCACSSGLKQETSVDFWALPLSAPLSSTGLCPAHSSWPGLLIFSCVLDSTESHSVVSNSLQSQGIVHGILQARILEMVAVFFSRDLPNPGIEPRSPALQVDSLPAEPQEEPQILSNSVGVSCPSVVFKNPFEAWGKSELGHLWDSPCLASLKA